MKIDQEFSNNAKSYLEHNTIQNKVALELIQGVAYQPKRIIDLGCGRGGLFDQIPWEVEHFIGVDFAHKMLELHPKGKGIECIFGNFNDANLYEQLFLVTSEHLFSASALQWADDLDRVLGYVKGLNIPVSLAIFTAGTFATINKTAGLAPLLRSSDVVKKAVDTHFNASFEVKQYQLPFNSTREMFRYIKKSGVSGSRQVLSFKETKKLMENYPLGYLEFEVAFIHSH